MKTLFTAEAISKGARSGTIESPGGLLDLKLGNPLEPGMETRGPNPELLFAAAYAACFNGALTGALKKSGAQEANIVVRALVSLCEDDQEAYHLAVELQAQIPGWDPDKVLGLMEVAHQTCPYSKALRGDAVVTLKSLSGSLA